MEETTREGLDGEAAHNVGSPQTDGRREPTLDGRTRGDASSGSSHSQPRGRDQPQQEPPSFTGPAGMDSDQKRSDEEMIFLKDAVQRKLTFPFKLAKTWHVG